MSIGLAAILLIGIGANFPNPGTYVQVNFAAGATSGAPGPQTALILGNKTSSGTATADTVLYGPDTSVPVQTETDVINLFGPGSQCHRAWRAFTRTNKQMAVYFVAVAESAGAQATGVVAVSGSATSSGNVRYWYGQDFVDVAVTSGDSATTIGGNLATAINNNVNWALTASNASGIVTITAKNHGPEGNWIKHQVATGPQYAPAGVTATVYGTVRANNTLYATGAFIQPAVANGYYYQVSTGGTTGGSPPSFPTTLGGTVSDGTATLTCWGTLSGVGIATLGGGATADNVTNALATVVASQFYNIVVCDSDATNLGRVVTQVNTQANPSPGIRQRVFAGSADTLANASTVAEGLNAARCELVWGGAATDVTPLEMAGYMAGIYTLYEQTGNTGYRYVGRCNFSLYPTANANYADSSNWPILGTRNGPANAPTVANITSALNNGVTPITVLANGQAQLVKRITTHCLNGSNSDWRIRDACKVAVMDAVATAMANVTQQQFGGLDLLDPPKQGQSPAGGQPPNVFATNVNLWGNALKDVVNKVGLAGLLQQTATTNANAIVQREANPRDRMSASFDLVTVDIADQFCVQANQVG